MWRDKPEFFFVCAGASSLVYIIREPLLAHLFNDNAQKRQLFKICTKMPENWSNRIARNCLETIPDILSIFIWHFAEDGEKKRNMFWFFLFIVPWRRRRCKVQLDFSWNWPKSLKYHKDIMFIAQVVCRELSAQSRVSTNRLRLIRTFFFKLWRRHISISIYYSTIKMVFTVKFID